MYLNVHLEDVCLYLFIYSSGATGVHWELYSEGSYPFFINLEAYAVVNAFKPVTFGAGAKNATRLESM